MPTPNVFDFPTENLALYRPDFIDTVLSTDTAIYVNHLHVAAYLAGWAARLDEGRDDDFARALRDIAAHLCQGDFTPDGILLRPVSG